MNSARSPKPEAKAISAALDAGALLGKVNSLLGLLMEAAEASQATDYEVRAADTLQITLGLVGQINERLIQIADN
jgi:hypothetical protein